MAHQRTGNQVFVIGDSGRAPGGVFTGANGQTITGNSSGAWAITANGTNQGITLTPSGTAPVRIAAGSGTNVLRVDAAGGQYLSVGDHTGTAGLLYLSASTDDVGLNSRNNQPINFLVNNTQAMRLATNGRLLLGTTTDSGALLQIGTNTTTSAGGMVFGTDTTFYRTSAGVLTIGHGIAPTLVLNANSGASTLTFQSDGSNGYISSTGGLILRSNNNVTALTLDSSQNATFVGAIIGGVQSLSGAGAVNVTQLHTSFTSTGAGQALTLANGTVGQIKTITHVVDGGSGVLTPTTALGYTTVTFTNAGDSVTLRYTSQGWAIAGIFGAVAA